MNSQRLFQCAHACVCGAALAVLAVQAADELAPDTACLRRLGAQQLSIQTVLAITTGSAPLSLSNTVPLAATNSLLAANSSNSTAAASAPAARRMRGARHRLIDLDGDGVADNRDF